MDLDEEAFPFEEKAISVHEKNTELLHAGVFIEWTKKSLGRLTELMPRRYAKHEMSGGFRRARQLCLPIAGVAGLRADIERRRHDDAYRLRQRSRHRWP